MAEDLMKAFVDRVLATIPANDNWKDGLVVDGQTATDREQFATLLAAKLRTATPEPAPAEAGYLSYSKVITNSEFIAARTVAIDIVPAPGANKILFPQSIYIRVLLPTGLGANDYGNIDATAQFIFSINFNQFPVYFLFDEAVDNTITNLIEPGDGIVSASAYSGVRSGVNASSLTTGLSGGFADADVVNLPLSFYYTNGAAGNFNGGNDANSFIITTNYSIIDIT